MSTKRATKIEALIRKQNLRQGELARAIGIPGSRLSEWKTGKWPMPAEVAVRLAKALDVTVEYLFDDKLDELPVTHDEDIRYLLQVIDDAGLSIRDAARRLLLPINSQPSVSAEPLPLPPAKSEKGNGATSTRARKRS